MLHVLRHYLPIRKAALIASELVILTMLVSAGMTAHLLWGLDDLILHRIGREGLSPMDARWRCLLSSTMVAVLAQIAIGFNELYDFRMSISRYDRAARFLGSAGSAILLVIVALCVTQAWNIERILDFPGLPFAQRLVLVVFTLMFGFGLLYLWRNLFHLILRHFSFDERVLILGTGPSAQRLADELRRRDDSGYNVVGMVTPSDAHGAGGDGDRRRWRRGEGDGSACAEGRAAPSTLPEVDTPAAPAALVATLVLAEDMPRPDPEAPPGEARGELPGEILREDLHALANRLNIDYIIVALEDRRGIMPTQALLHCRLSGMVVEEAESLYERVTGKIAIEAMRPSYLIFNRGFTQHPLAATAKRGVDIVLALLVLLAAWPAMILTALAIRFDSPGPVLFRQEREGRQGVPFTLLKFRSMRQDAEKQTGPVWATEDDPRITRVGRFLRRMRLDELPQLFNVLGGSMSMIGPRPERPNFVSELAQKIPYFRQRHIVKPGLTGWAQINYPYGNTIEDANQKLQYDLFYIKYQSALFDLSILFNTIKTVLLRKGT